MGAQSTATTTVDFGVFPGKTDTSLAITGQTGILAASLVEAWMLPQATADHTADEHWVEDIMVVAGNIVVGTGFTIYARIIDPETIAPVLPDARVVGPGTGANQPRPEPAPPATRLYGLYTVAWCWN